MKAFIPLLLMLLACGGKDPWLLEPTLDGAPADAGSNDAAANDGPIFMKPAHDGGAQDSAADADQPESAAPEASTEAEPVDGAADADATDADSAICPPRTVGTRPDTCSQMTGTVPTTFAISDPHGCDWIATPKECLCDYTCACLYNSLGGNGEICPRQTLPTYNWAGCNDGPVVLVLCR